MQCFLIYIDDWLSSKKIEMMDRDEELAYFHMLLKSAKEDDCGLPDDDQQLSVISRLGSQWFKPTRDKAKRFGNLTSGQKIRKSFLAIGSRIFNERLVREFQHQKEVNAKRSGAGKSGAAKRWAGLEKAKTVEPTTDLADGKPIANGIADALANALPTQWQNDANHSLGLGLVVGSKNKTSTPREFNLDFHFAEFIADWPDLSELALAKTYYLDKVVSKPDPFAAHAKLMAAKLRWEFSDRWHHGYTKSPGKWLGEDKEEDFPKPCACGQRVHVTQEIHPRAGPGAKQSQKQAEIDASWEGV